jgi:anti-sigma regulatory factor (Ser/Thr protein kinase)
MEGQLKVALPRDRSSASRARYLVAELSAATLDSAELDRAKLLVSELVTNALVHGRGVITRSGRGS